MAKPKVVLACMYQDFGQAEMLPDKSNASWEYFNIYQPWQKLHDDGVVELIHVHWLNLDNNTGGFDKLLAIAPEADFVFQVAVNHGLSICKPYCDKILALGIPIVDYPPDIWARYDHHTPENWIVGRYREGYVSHFLSPARHVIDRMKNDGLPVRYMPFGIAETFHKIDCDVKYPVSFVGQAHGIRQNVIDQLRGGGIEVHTFGHFWKPHKHHHGRPGYDEVNRIFNESAININLRWTSRSHHRGIVNGRSFEIPGAGAFMLATKHFETEDFNQLYTPGEEFAEADMADMVDLIRHYVSDDVARQAMADKAYAKREKHLWTTRLRDFLESEFWEL